VNLNDLHRRLLQDVLAIGNTFPFVITGGYAVFMPPPVSAHSLSSNPWGVCMLVMRSA
jgi:hypothetical protein